MFLGVLFCEALKTLQSTTDVDTKMANQNGEQILKLPFIRYLKLWLAFAPFSILYV